VRGCIGMSATRARIFYEDGGDEEVPLHALDDVPCAMEGYTKELGEPSIDKVWFL